MLIKDQEARLNLEDIKLSKWMKINEKMASFQDTYQHKIMTRDKTETTKESSKVVTRFFSKPKTTHEESNAEINEGGIIINPNNYSIRPRFIKTNENMIMSQDEIIKNKIFKVPTLIEDYSVNFSKELF